MSSTLDPNADDEQAGSKLASCFRMACYDFSREFLSISWNSEGHFGTAV